jgi:predicted nuclease with RNAse H fold
MLVAGVDISERRGQMVALLDDASLSVVLHLVKETERAAEIDAVVRLLCGQAVDVVAIDSPLQPSRSLLRDGKTRRALGLPDRRGMNGLLYANYRVCDYELIRRGMPLYQVAAEEAAAAPWMRVGFDLAAALRDAGSRLPVHHADHSASLIEVFPDAAFVTLLGARPARKSLPEGRAQRRAILMAAGVSVAETLTHDELDATAAALTAFRWRRGVGCALGHPDEGLIVLPVPRSSLHQRYARLPSATGILQS